MILVGIDVGGTFTDFIYLNHETGKTDIHKVSTTPDDPSIGVITGLLELVDKGKLKPFCALLCKYVSGPRLNAWRNIPSEFTI